MAIQLQDQVMNQTPGVVKGQLKGMAKASTSSDVKITRRAISKNTLAKGIYNSKNAARRNGARMKFNGKK